MRTFLSITKALNDQTRLRSLLALGYGELCLCQLIELFDLAPSTISKHLLVLYDAGLVDRRREGKWAYFKLAGSDASPQVKQAIAWVIRSLGDATEAKEDAKKLSRVLKKDPKELCGCYA